MLLHPKEKETRVKFNPGLSASRPLNNWAHLGIRYFNARFYVSDPGQVLIEHSSASLWITFILKNCLQTLANDHFKHSLVSRGCFSTRNKELIHFTFTQNLLLLINLAKVKKLYLLLSYKRSFIEASALSVLGKLLTWAMQR